MTTNTQTLTFHETLRVLFPIPDNETLDREANSTLPFARFGMTGGYGQTRGELVDAIKTRNVEQVVIKFYDLIEEGIRDEQVERSLDQHLNTGDSPQDLISIAYELAVAINHFKANPISDNNDF